MPLAEEMAQFAKDAVERGAELLDSSWPGWALEINLDVLSLSDSCRCILGQLSGVGDYNTGVREVMCSDLSMFTTEAFQEAPNFGFIILPRELVNDPWEYEDLRAYYGLLDELWIEQVKKRFDQGIQL